MPPDDRGGVGARGTFVDEFLPLPLTYFSSSSCLSTLHTWVVLVVLPLGTFFLSSVFFLLASAGRDYESESDHKSGCSYREGGREREGGEGVRERERE